VVVFVFIPSSQIELENGCEGGGADVQKKHSETWTEDLFGRGENTIIIYGSWLIAVILTHDVGGDQLIK